MHTETGIDAIERTLQKTNVWIKELEAALGWDDRHFAFQALRAVLRLLRDRLPQASAIHLGDQLPLLVRGAYYENWSPKLGKAPIRKADEFLDRVAEAFPKEYNLDAPRMVRSVFGVLKTHIAPGEAKIVRANLPSALHAFWD